MVTLSPETVDDLIYSARVGDLEALRTDIAQLSETNKCSPAEVICGAIDAEPESEGGSGSCLLHFPAANGNLEILSYLLEILSPTTAATTTTTANTDAEQQDTDEETTRRRRSTALINHKNYSGNTPLHWAALNTHLECVKALVACGADVSIKNQQGFDAAFLAERAEWSGASAARETQDDKNDNANASANGNGNANEDAKDQGDKAPPMTEGLKVVEFLLMCDDGQGKEKDEKEKKESQPAQEDEKKGSQ